MQKLLLHICCGPCATHVVESLHQKYNITGYFYNPNIYPEEEYKKRLDAAMEVAKRTAVKGFENEPENGKRCNICYRLRFYGTAQYAADNSFDCIASTLTLGPQKKASIINPIGISETEKAGLSFIEGDWKKKDGFKRSCELSHEYGIYRQNYCGCLFSISREDNK